MDLGSTAFNNLILDSSASIENDYYSIITWEAEITWQLYGIEELSFILDLLMNHKRE